MAASELAEPASPAGTVAAKHSDPFSFILLQLALVVAAAMVGRRLATAAKQPSVIGELLVGVLIGNVGYWHESSFCTFVMNLGAATPVFVEMAATGDSALQAAERIFSTSELAPGGIGDRVMGFIEEPADGRFVTIGFSLWLFANLGVVLLLFKAGLESSIKGMLAVGGRAAGVAIVGTVAPFVLGIAATSVLLPAAPLSTHLFLATALCATSIGITARVLEDLGRERSREARIVLGAAVIDDVLALILLAVVIGIAASGQVDYRDAARIAISAAVFLGGVIWFGERLVKLMLPAAAALDRSNVRLLFPLLLAFAMAWVANLIQLATIVGAFAAGLVLNESNFASYKDRLSVREWIAPLESVFAPIFFVLIGMQVNLAELVRVEALALGAGLLVVAVVGKLVSGGLAGAGTDRLSVGIGMVPRGEVGLIFASIGKGLGVVTDDVFAALVVVVIATTFLAPLALQWSLARSPATT